METIKEAFALDGMARAFHMELMDIEPGYAVVSMPTDSGQTNIFGSVHGGAIFALLDSAFQLACNSHGKMAVALNVNITYTAAAMPGDTLVATVKEESRTSRTAAYQCTVTGRDGLGSYVTVISTAIWLPSRVHPISSGGSQLVLGNSPATTRKTESQSNGQSGSTPNSSLRKGSICAWAMPLRQTTAARVVSTSFLNIMTTSRDSRDDKPRSRVVSIPSDVMLAHSGAMSSG